MARVPAHKRVEQARRLVSVDDARRLYHDWARDYDSDIADELRFTGGDRIAALLAAHAPSSSIKVLDIGCGTGLVGAALGQHGFTDVDGLDLSAAMLAAARDKRIYGTLIEADLMQPLALADGCYDAVICAGTFISGHVDASRMGEIVRLIRPGGHLACVIAEGFWHDGGFAERLAELQSVGTLAIVHDTIEPVAEKDAGEAHFVVAAISGDPDQLSPS